MVNDGMFFLFGCGTVDFGVVVFLFCQEFIRKKELKFGFSLRES
jgi:hypothetical protein